MPGETNKNKKHDQEPQPQRPAGKARQPAAPRPASRPQAKPAARPAAKPATRAATKPAAKAPARTAAPAPAAFRRLPKAPGVAGLVYVSDDLPGYARGAFSKTRGFSYRDTQGKPITDENEIRRIDKLAIPPAYTAVWICPLANGHLQATGRDARGRKQYRYHPDWQAQRNGSKFDRLEAFGRALPRIRAQVSRDLKPARAQPVGRRLVLATLVRLLDTTFVRVGNDEYARDNGSYGLTTLRNPHAGVRGKTLRLRFRGKSGVMQDVTVDDPKVAAVVRRCQQLPGQMLFQYQDENGEVHGIGSGDVNDYLAEIAGAGAGQAGGEHFTAKDFRTWHGTAQALELTRLACSAGAAEMPPAGHPPAAGKLLKKSKSPAYSVKAVLAEVAGLLGNTPAVCRKSYIHPAVMSLGAELAEDAGAMAAMWDKLDGGKKTRRLYAAEHRLLGFLKNRGQNQQNKESQQKARGTSGGKPGGKRQQAGSR